MDEVKRQSGEHQAWEREWETAFNIHLRLQSAITMVIAWITSHVISFSSFLPLWLYI